MSEHEHAPDPSPLLGGRYRLERQLAQGGMAEVWVATDTLLSRRVAIKLLKPYLAQDPVVAERFRREAIAVAGLSHPNIVAVHDTVDDGGRQAVVMQYVAGKSLRQLLDEQRKLGPDLTIHIGTAVASALDAAHRAGLVHRDVKPGNILLTPDGRVLLADFGIAKAIDGDEGHDLTSDNIMMGTAKYLSPEQVRGRRLDGRADLYSLGLVLYECLAGRVPFLGETDADTALARLQRDPTDLGRLRPTLPRGLVDLIHQLLEREPDDRPETGAVVRTTLARVLSGADERTTASTRPRARASERKVPATPGGSRDHTPPAIPGEPLADRTPPSVGPARAAPARGLQQRWAPSLVVVGVLLVAAAITVAVLWMNLDGAASDGDGTPSDGDATEQTDPDAPGDSAPVDDGTPPEVVRWVSYDPNGDGTENDDQLRFLVDGDATTRWTTVCYANEYLGAKQGVGVVAELNRPASGTVLVDVASGPWQLRLYTADELHDSLAAWGPYRSSDFGNEPRQVTWQMAEPARYLLIWMTQLARHPACSAENPFQGALSQVQVALTG